MARRVMWLGSAGCVLETLVYVIRNILHVLYFNTFYRMPRDEVEIGNTPCPNNRELC